GLGGGLLCPGRTAKTLAHSLEPNVRSHVVKVGGLLRPVVTKFRNRNPGTDDARGFLGLGEARITLGPIVVVGANDDLGARKLVAQHLRYEQQISGIKSDVDGAAGGRVNGRASGESFSKVNGVAARAGADGEIAAGYLPAWQETLFAAGIDDLQRPYPAVNAYRHKQMPTTGAFDPVRLDVLPQQVRVIIGRGV